MGGYSYFTYKHCQINILGASLENLPLEDLFKSLLLIDPAMILVDVAPDDCLE